MNFNIYVNKDIGKKIIKVAEDQHRSHDSIINEALEEWLSHHTTEQWPKDFFDFTPIEDVPDFKAMSST